VTHDLELGRHALEDLAHLLAQAAQLTAAFRTDAAGCVHNLFARQMLG
jgi:hypothetical protein